VLSQQPTLRKVTDIENLILGTQGATRRFFVVDEEIQSSKQPAERRSVVDFVGQTNGVALGSNVSPLCRSSEDYYFGLESKPPMMLRRTERCNLDFRVWRWWFR
jgi:hypothetical protein